jgi:hypothetical protein
MTNTKNITNSSQINDIFNNLLAETTISLFFFEYFASTPYNHLCIRQQFRDINYYTKKWKASFKFFL